MRKPGLALALLGLVPIVASFAHSNSPRPAPGLTLRPQRIALPTGVTLEYVEQGSATGQPLLFLHGYSDSWRSWEPILPLLPARLHAYALTLRGHGDSERPAQGYGQRDFAADVVAFMDTLGIDQATLVGHSMGSFIAQKVAVDQPERVAGLVLVGSGPSMVGNSAVLELNKTVQRLTDPVDPDFVREFQLSTAAGHVPMDYLEIVVAESLKMPAHVWHEALSNLLEEDHHRDLHRLTMPTLILWGEEDGILDREAQETLVALLANATLEVYLQTGHALHWEQPQRFSHDLESFQSTLMRDRVEER